MSLELLRRQSAPFAGFGGAGGPKQSLGNDEETIDFRLSRSSRWATFTVSHRNRL
jgi:hypothetical protein